MPPVTNQNPNPNNVYPSPSGSMGQFDPTQAPLKPKKHIDVLLLPLIISIVLLLAAIGFGVWAFMSRQDYKNNSDERSAQAVETAEAAQAERLEKDFLEREKEPLKQYEGPAVFGSVNLLYPKTWSAYVTTSDTGSMPIDGYLHPDVVPGLDSGTAYALHFQVTNTAYDQELRKFESDAKSGKVTISAVTAPKVPNVAGVRITGEVENDKQGTLVMFPLRDKTLKVISESSQFEKDFNEIILPNMSFAP